MLCGCLGNNRSRPLRGFGVINLSSLQDLGIYTQENETETRSWVERRTSKEPRRVDLETGKKHTKMLAQATLQKLRNAESSLVFMREQHARTLEGLHEEIHKLQKKNASEFNRGLIFCLAPPWKRAWVPIIKSSRARTGRWKELKINHRSVIILRVL